MSSVGAPAVIWSSNSIPASDSSRTLLFESGGVNFALATEHVVEVIELPNPNYVAGAPVWFAGLAVYKSRPVPVIDMGKYFDPAAAQRIADKHTQSQSRAIVVQLAGSTYLLKVEKVLSLGELPLDDANYPAPMSNMPDLAEHRAVERVCLHENKLIALLNLPELLRLTKFLRECRIV